MSEGWPTPMSEGTTTVTGYPVFYRICGDASARETVLCLHGGPGATHDYLQPLADLGRRGYRVVFMDQLGCGRSKRITDTSLFTLEHHLQEVFELQENLALGRVHLFGSSYGGALALAYAIAHPGAVRSVITAGGLASVPLTVSEERKWITQLPAAIQDVLRQGEATGDFTSPEYEAAMMEFYRRHLCRLDPWPEPVVYSLAQMSGPVYHYMNGPNEFTIVGTLRDLDFSSQLPRIQVPTLVTGGRYDEVSPVVARQIADGVPGAEIEIFEQSSHMPFWEERERFVARVARFLERVRSTGS
ncbi:MAG: proline iminopeptidase-family hydrolase [Thermoplasmata archaeon]